MIAVVLTVVFLFLLVSSLLGLWQYQKNRVKIAELEAAIRKIRGVVKDYYEK